MAIKNTKEIQTDPPLVDVRIERKNAAKSLKTDESEGRLLFWGIVKSADLPA